VQEVELLGRCQTVSTNKRVDDTCGVWRFKMDCLVRRAMTGFALPCLERAFWVRIGCIGESDSN
jgi:hypothetical protein